jgi:DNA-binding HxlR family transcriptional regulator
MIKVNGKNYTCPIEVSMDLIAGKWKLLIMWHLRNKTRRFGELQRKIPNVTQKMLTQQLRELEAANLVRREVYPVVPPKVEYSLTEFGDAFKPILNMMLVWGQEYAEHFGEVGYELPWSIEPDFRQAVKDAATNHAEI